METIDTTANVGSGEIIFAMVACVVFGIIISFYIISKIKNKHR